MKSRLPQVFLCVLLLASCAAEKMATGEVEVPVTTVEEKPVEVIPEPEMLLLKLAKACAADIYSNGSIDVNTRLYIYQLDARFTQAAGTFTVRVKDYQVTKVTVDSLVFFNFLPDSMWCELSLDSAEVEVTCVYEITGLEKHPLPACVTNSYTIREELITNHLDYRSCY